jgi:Ni2+-binding GTPase involved in maturation of urease and hydrogenase
MLKIGVYGQPGVGKTSILEKICENRELVKKMQNNILIYEVCIGENKLQFYNIEDSTAEEFTYPISLYIYDCIPDTIPEISVDNNSKIIMCVNKADLLANTIPEMDNVPKNLIFTSALTGEGIESLINLIFMVSRI